MDIPTDAEGSRDALIRRDSTSQLVELKAPRARPPGILHLVARGLPDVAKSVVRVSDKHLEHAVKVAVAHYVGDRRRAKLGRKQAQLVPLALKAGRSVLPRVVKAVISADGKNFDAIHKGVYGHKGIVHEAVAGVCHEGPFRPAGWLARVAPRVAPVESRGAGL